jgi:hypothetical protein
MGSSSVATQLATSQEGLISTELVSERKRLWPNFGYSLCSCCRNCRNTGNLLQDIQYRLDRNTSGNQGLLLAIP